MVKISSVEMNVGRSWIFINLLVVCVSARISSTGDNPDMRSRRGVGVGCTPTYGDRVVDIFGLTTMGRSTDDSFWPWVLSSSSNMRPGESTIRRPRSSQTGCNSLVCPAAPQRHTPSPRRCMRHQNGKKISTQGNTTTHLGPFEGVDQTAFADIGEANDTDGDTLHCARFVRLGEADECRGGARC
jgi:hypothetical protein